MLERHLQILIICVDVGHFILQITDRLLKSAVRSLRPSERLTEVVVFGHNVEHIQLNAVDLRLKIYVQMFGCLQTCLVLVDRSYGLV